MIVVIAAKERNVKIVAPRRQSNLLEIPGQRLYPRRKTSSHFGKRRLIRYHFWSNSGKFCNKGTDGITGANQTLKAIDGFELFVEVDSSHVNNAVVRLSSLFVLTGCGFQIKDDDRIVQFEHGVSVPQEMTFVSFTM